MTPRANAAAMLASGRRNADRFHGELFAVYVNQPNLTAEDRSALGAQRHAGARAARRTSTILEGQRSDRRDPRLRAQRKASRSSSSATTSGARGAPRSTGSLLDRLIAEPKASTSASSRTDAVTRLRAAGG